MRILSLVLALIIIFVLMGWYLRSTQQGIDAATGKTVDTTVVPTPGPGGYIEAARKNVDEINRAAQLQDEEARKVLEKDR